MQHLYMNFHIPFFQMRRGRDFNTVYFFNFFERSSFGIDYEIDKVISSTFLEVHELVGYVKLMKVYRIRNM